MRIPPFARRPGSAPVQGIRLLVVTGGLLVALAFAPLFYGRNCLPFARFPQWTKGFLQTNGQAIAMDDAYIQRRAATPWLAVPEFAAAIMNWPLDLFAARELRQARLPLWDPYTGCGVPTLDTGQFRPFYPLNWLFYAHPTTWMFCVGPVLGLLLSWTGMWVLLKRRGLSPLGRAFGAGLFALNPWTLERVLLTDVSVYVWLPWCLLALHAVRWRRWWLLGFPLLAFTLAGHAGHPEAALLVSLVAAVDYLWYRGPGASEETGLLGRVAVLAVVGPLVLGATSILWYPAVKMLLNGYSYKRDYFQLFYHDWRAFLVPSSELFILPALGVLLVACWPVRARYAHWVTILGLSALALIPIPGLGEAGFSRLLQTTLQVPPFYFKLTFWASLSLLLPHGLEALEEKRPHWAQVLVPASVFVALGAFAFVNLPLPAQAVTRWPLPTGVLLLAATAFLCLHWTVRTWRLPPVGTLVLLLLPVAYPLSLDHLPWNGADIKLGDPVSWIKDHRPHDRIVSVGYDNLYAVPPNLGTAYGVRCGEQVGVLFTNSYYQLFRQPNLFPTLVMYDRPFLSAFSQLGASIALYPSDRPAPGLTLLVRGNGFSAYEIAGSSGRLYFAERVARRQDGPKLVKQIIDLCVGTDRVALLEGMGRDLPKEVPALPPGAGTASFVQDEPQLVVLHASASSGGLLVLKDSWYPGWRATVDGHPEPIYRVNGCFRGVLLAAGTHQVRFEYCPADLYLAGWISALITGLALAGAGLSLRRGGEAGKPSAGPSGTAAT